MFYITSILLMHNDVHILSAHINPEKMNKDCGNFCAHTVTPSLVSHTQMNLCMAARQNPLFNSTSLQGDPCPFTRYPPGSHSHPSHSPLPGFHKLPSWGGTRPPSPGLGVSPSLRPSSNEWNGFLCTGRD